MIWNDAKIKQWASNGGVTPYDESLVNPASLDLRLGRFIREPLKCWHMKPDRMVTKKTPASEMWTDVIEFTTYTLNPGDLILCHSLEFTRIPVDACAMLLSKSSTGRIGLEHLHAGWGDSGFSGEWVFEIKNLAPWPIELRPHECYMQLVMMDMVAAPEKSYQITGRYNGQTGPEAHR